MGNSKTDFIENLFANLNSNEIDYFVLGEYHNLPLKIENSDLDIIVAPLDIEIFLQVLKDLLSKYNVKVVSYYTNSNAKFYRLLCESDTYWGLQLDLFCKGLFFQTKEYFPIAELKNDILLYNDIKVLSLKKAYFVGFLKEIIHNGCSKKKYINGFITEVLSDEIKYRKLLTKLYSEEFAKIVFENLSTNNLKNKTKKLREIMLGKIYNGKSVFLKNSIERIKNGKRVCTPPGYTIVFLGEQSSRERIITTISPVLNEAFYNSVFYESNRPNYIYSNKKTTNKSNDIKEFDSISTSKKPFTLASWNRNYFSYFLDYTFGYWMKIFPKKAFNSCVWIFDGYYYDNIINPKKARWTMQNWIIKIGALLVPEPDLILCLGSSAELDCNKKYKSNIEGVDSHLSRLSKFCLEHKKAVWINTEGPLKQSVDDTMKAVLEVMVKRFAVINQDSK